MQEVPRLTYSRGALPVLLVEGISPSAEEAFRKGGFRQIRTVQHSLPEEELVQEIKDVSVFGGRSKTELSATVFQAADRLLTVGAYCIGTNQIDLDAATERGVAVFNDPVSNANAVKELVVGFAIDLSRGVTDNNEQMHKGVWSKSSKGSREIQGSTVGIIGMGNVGQMVARSFEWLGADVVYYDSAKELRDTGSPVTAKRMASMEDVLKASDIVTIHVDGRPENHNLIGPAELAVMKDGAKLINASRGFVLDNHATAEAVRAGKLGGVAVDVFPYEPNSGEPFESPLQGLSNVILSSHRGGSTEEAQDAIGRYTSRRQMDFVNIGSTKGSVNLPYVDLPPLAHSSRFIHIHENRPGVMAGVFNVFAKHNINVAENYLGTNPNVGVVILDTNELPNRRQVVQELRQVPGTFSARSLYKAP